MSVSQFGGAPVGYGQPAAYGAPLMASSRSVPAVAMPVQAPRAVSYAQPTYQAPVQVPSYQPMPQMASYVAPPMAYAAPPPMPAAEPTVVTGNPEYVPVPPTVEQPPPGQRLPANSQLPAGATVETREVSGQTIAMPPLPPTFRYEKLEDKSFAPLEVALPPQAVPVQQVVHKTIKRQLKIVKVPRQRVLVTRTGGPAAQHSQNRVNVDGGVEYKYYKTVVRNVRVITQPEIVTREVAAVQEFSSNPVEPRHFGENILPEVQETETVEQVQYVDEWLPDITELEDATTGPSTFTQTNVPQVRVIEICVGTEMVWEERTETETQYQDRPVPVAQIVNRVQPIVQQVVKVPGRVTYEDLPPIEETGAVIQDRQYVAAQPQVAYAAPPPMQYMPQPQPMVQQAVPSYAPPVQVASYTPAPQMQMAVPTTTMMPQAYPATQAVMPQAYAAPMTTMGSVSMGALPTTVMR